MKKELVIIIILSICVLGLGGFIIYDQFLKDEPAIEENKNNETNEKENNNEQNNEETEINFVKDELQKLENALNKEVKDWNSPCFNLANSFVANYYVETTEFFDVMAPYIMQCLYEKEYTIIVGPILDLLLFSSKDLNEFYNYFNINLETKPFDASYNSDEMMSSNPNITDYFNGDYVVVATYEAGLTDTPYEYKINDISKQGNYYVATITMENIPGKSSYSADEKIIYEGTLKVSILNNHLRYEPLYFKKQN